MNTQSLTTFLQDKCHLFDHNLLAVGVSGGADSLSLLHLLKQSGYPLIALHFDHALRSESDADAKFVTDTCKNWGIPCVVARQDVGRYSTDNHMSIEEAARILRYRFLFSKAAEREASALVVAHHANDQVETVLMHFLRGAGMDGLRGMQPIVLLPEFNQSIPLVRPLLSVWKSEVNDYCHKHHIDFLEDHTNLDPRYYRNWLRLQLIPEIEERNPGFQQSVLRTSDVISAQHELINGQVENGWKELNVEFGTGWLRIDRDQFLKSSLALQREYIRKAILSLKPTIRDLDFNTVERVVGWISWTISEKYTDILAGIRCFQRTGGLFFALPGSTLPVDDYPQIIMDGLELTIPGATKLNHRWMITSEEANLTPTLFDYIKTCGAGEAFMDMDQICNPLTLRGRTAGDRITLLGMADSQQKISDVMINQKIPVYARSNYPLVVSNGKIIWIPGVQISEKVRISPQTRRILHLTLRQT